MKAEGLIMGDRTDAWRDLSLIPQPSSSSGRRFRHYPEYKDSRIEWLGKIPTHWRTKRLKYLSAINNETLGEDTDPNLEISYVDIGSVDEIGGIVKIEEFAFEKAPSRARRIVRDGDVIVSTVRTYLRAIAPITVTKPCLIVSTGFAVIRPKTGLDSSFTSYALRAPYFVDRVVANSVGVSYPAINASEVGCFALAAPDVREQRAIAEFLDWETGKIDALVAKKERLIEVLLEKRTALITHAVTKGLDPDIPMRDSGIEWLGEVPAHWTGSFKLLQLAKQGRGTFVNGPFGSDLLTSELVSEGVPVIYIRDLSALGYHRVSSVCVTSKKAQQLDFCRVDRGDILIAKVGDPPGIAAVYPDSELPGIVTQDVIRIKPNNNVVNRHYLTYFLNSAAGAALIDKIAVEATRRRISLGDFKRSRLILPPLQDQTAIAAFLDRECKKIERLITKIREGIDCLKEFRTALISAAVTGKIDVREEVA